MRSKRAEGSPAISEKMRALVLDAPLERILQIGEITKPRIEKPYNVLVKVIAAGSIRLAGKTG